MRISVEDAARLSTIAKATVLGCHDVAEQLILRLSEESQPLGKKIADFGSADPVAMDYRKWARGECRLRHYSDSVNSLNAGVQDLLKAKMRQKVNEDPYCYAQSVAGFVLSTAQMADHLRQLLDSRRYGNPHPSLDEYMAYLVEKIESEYLNCFGTRLGQ